MKTRLQVQIEAKNKDAFHVKLLSWFQEGRFGRFRLIRCGECSAPLRWDYMLRKEKVYWNDNGSRCLGIYNYWVAQACVEISDDFYRCGECGQEEQEDMEYDSD